MSTFLLVHGAWHGAWCWDRVVPLLRAAAPVIAVGHSMGGLVITQAAAEEPRLFAGLVYLCAFAPKRGESLLSLARTDANSRVPDATRWGLGRVAIRPERGTAAFYNACTPEDAQHSIGRLVRNPILPLLQRVDRPDDLGVPQAYIECARDQAISIDLQRRMHRRFAMERVVTMDADHSPFLFAPEELASHLDSIAQTFTGSAS